MIRYEENQIILSGETAKSFVDRLNNPSEDIIRRRKQYFREIESSLMVRKADGKIFIRINKSK